MVVFNHSSLLSLQLQWVGLWAAGVFALIIVFFGQLASLVGVGLWLDKENRRCVQSSGFGRVSSYICIWLVTLWRGDRIVSVFRIYTIFVRLLFTSLWTQIRCGNFFFSFISFFCSHFIYRLSYCIFLRFKPSLKISEAES